MTANLPPTSRYVGVGVASYEDANGVVTAYLLRRFLPHPELLALLRLHVVAEGERLDNVTAAHLGDPEQFWRVADANRAMRPDDLMVIGRALRITLPDGIPGVADA